MTMTKRTMVMKQLMAKRLPLKMLLRMLKMKSEQILLSI